MIPRRAAKSARKAVIPHVRTRRFCAPRRKRLRLRSELVEQRPARLEIGRLEALGEAIINRRAARVLLCSGPGYATSARGWWRHVVPRTTHPAAVPSRALAGNDPPLLLS